MITKRIASRKDGKSSAIASLRYGEGLTPDRETGEFLDKSHRTRFGNFGLVDDGIYAGQGTDKMSKLIELAAVEMQANCDLNTRVGADKKIAHFIVSFNQTKPTDATLQDTEDTILAALKLDQNHFATFLHNDNGYWHLHFFVSRIDKIKHLGNPLWQDKTIRDKVCREIEIRHHLDRDNGLYKIDEIGQIVEVPREVRWRNQAEKNRITDRAQTTEKYSGEKSFQTWCNEIRIGDRLKHAKNWQDLHAAAAAYGCEIKQRGAGFIILPSGEKGGIQLSKVGLKNIPSKFGVFQSAKFTQKNQPETAYTPSPTNEKAVSHYESWRTARNSFRPLKTKLCNEQRDLHNQIRKDLRMEQKTELSRIRAEVVGAERFAALSVAKMKYAVDLAALSETFSRERMALRRQIAEQGPGNTFRDFLVKEAAKGDEVALKLARKYGTDESTFVSRQREVVQLQIVAAFSGQQNLLSPRMHFSHRVERSGSIVYNLGFGRTITDSAVSKQVQLNSVAANNPEAIAIALRFASNKFGNTLTLTGSPEFQRLAVETAVRKGLFIDFKDPVLQKYKQEFAATINQEKHYVTRPQPYQTKRIPPAHRRDRLHQMSELTLATKPKDVEVLLPKDVPSSMANRDEGRRNGSGLRRVGNEGRNDTDVVSFVPTQFVTCADWIARQSKPVVAPKLGDGKVIFKVVHAAADGFVLSLGREVVWYPAPPGLNMRVDTQVVINKDGTLALLAGKEGRENELG